MPDFKYQVELKHEIYKAWTAGAKVVGCSLATGGGKTRVFCRIAQEWSHGKVVIIPHRQEICTQISKALASQGSHHNIIATKSIVKACCAQNASNTGQAFYNPSSNIVIAMIDTLLSRHKRGTLGDWINHVGLWIQDEGHHILKNNKWGKAAKIFSDARGLAPTATPCRADNKGLGSESDGLMDFLVEVITQRQLIDSGYLCDYTVHLPTTLIDTSNCKIAANGDYAMPGLIAATQASSIVGDLPESYLRFAPGKRGITFATDVATAGLIADMYNAKGIPAQVVHGGSGDAERMRALNKFKRGELLQLVNCDLFGEGFDVPGVEVVTMARRTLSFSLYCQQIGRALRLSIDPRHYDKWDDYSVDKRLQIIRNSDKPKAILIDHVGNFLHFGPPDAPREWVLNPAKRERTSKVKPSGLKACTNPECCQPIPRHKVICPYCGHRDTPVSNRTVQVVDGDLIELHPAEISRMRETVYYADRPADEYMQHLRDNGCPAIGLMRNRRCYIAKQEARQSLRDAIDKWAGARVYREKLSLQEVYRKFYLQYGVDTLSCQTWSVDDMNRLKERVLNEVRK